MKSMSEWNWKTKENISFRNFTISLQIHISVVTVATKLHFKSNIFKVLRSNKFPSVVNKLQ